MHFPGVDFDRATPEAMGVESRAIEGVLKAIERDFKDIHSMLVLRDGVLVHEQYFAPYGPDTPHAMYSCSKTFTSMLVGIAQEKGLLSIHDKVLSFFPEVEVEHPSENLRNMTLRDLLVMGSGHGEDTAPYVMDGKEDDWVKVFLNRPVDYTPGTHFVYNTGATYMASAILTKVTGRSALSLAQEWIFSKIGIQDAQWQSCPRGISLGGTGLFIRPRDMARFGLLIANEGVWKGEQVIPAEYIREARTKQIENHRGNPDPVSNWNVGYGYQMWRCRFGAFRADGMGGQFIVMFPEKNLVVVFTSGLGSDIGVPLEYEEDILLPGVHDAPIPEDEEALEALLRRSKSMAHPAPLSNHPALPWGEYGLEENPLGLHKIILEPGKVELEGEKLSVNGPYQWGAPAISRAKVPGGFLNAGGTADVAVSAWMRDETPVLKVNVVGEPATLYLRFSFDDAGATVDASYTMGETATLRATRLA